MTHKRLALIGYPSDYFVPFGRALEQTGFEVYWVCSVPSYARLLTGIAGVPAHRVLDVTAGFDPGAGCTEECRADLAALESVGGPRLNDVILMDRLLRRKSEAFARSYLHHVQRMLTRFLLENGISLVSSGRDTALQMVSMLVSRRLGIPWVVPTRLRIPRDLYGFCPGHETVELIRFRPVTAADRAWAETFLTEFTEKSLRPAIQKAARGFGDDVRLLPDHARAFRLALKASLVDAGNDYSRYTIPRLIRMYVSRRINLVGYKLFPPYSPPADVPFCLYTLHTQPESSIDVAGSFFSDQIALITFIARSLPVTHELYVKVHPADVDGKPLSFYRRIANIPGVRLIGYDVDSRALVRRASIIFALTGTVAYEAGMMARTVVTFANNFFNTLPTVHRCDAPPQLPALIDRLLDAPPPAGANERILEFLADMKSSCFDGEINRTYGEKTADLSSDDLRTLQVAYDSLYDVLVLRADRVEAPAAQVS